MNTVNFFLIGAPKCGTTSLHYYLDQHPDIVMSHPKEPHFFGSDLTGYRAHDNKEQYEGMFSDAAEKLHGEASVFYLMSEDAISQIRSYNPEAKIIIMLRDPIEMLPSLHAQLCFTQDENISDFDTAWTQSKERAKGTGYPTRARSKRPLSYRTCAMYGQQVSRVQSFFPNENIFIGSFDKIKENSSLFMSEVFEFLGLDDHSESLNYKIQNKNTKNRLDFAARLLRHPPKPLINMKRAIMGRGESKLRSALLDLNTITTKRKELSKQTKDEIIEHYTMDLSLLADLTKLDTKNWLK